MGNQWSKGLYDRTMTLEEWLSTLKKHKPCKKITSMDQYRELRPNVYCMYMIVPMYYYGPLDLENLDMEDFNPNDLNDMLNSISVGKRDDYLRKYPIEK